MNTNLSVIETKELMNLGKTFAYRAQSGEITYNEAKEKCAPIIKEVNTRMKAIADKYKKTGMKGVRVTQIKIFTDFLRIK